MQLPSEFKCAGNTIKVQLVEKTHNNNYGNWCDVTNTITIAKTIELEDKTVVRLTEDQITNTFWHELFIVFSSISIIVIVKHNHKFMLTLCVSI